MSLATSVSRAQWQCNGSKINVTRENKSDSGEAQGARRVRRARNGYGVSKTIPRHQGRYWRFDPYDAVTIRPLDGDHHAAVRLTINRATGVSVGRVTIRVHSISPTAKRFASQPIAQHRPANSSSREASWRPWATARLAEILASPIAIVATRTGLRLTLWACPCCQPCRNARRPAPFAVPDRPHSTCRRRSGQRPCALCRSSYR